MNMREPLVSVVTVSYNSGEFIRETIESVLRQSYQHIEYIILDDCSSDNSWEIIKKYDDSRIKAIRNHNNIGEYANRNKAVSIASGEYLIFIDGDDIMYPHALSVFVKYALDFPDCAILIARDWDYRIRSPYKVISEDFYRFEYFDFTLLSNFTKLLFRLDVLKSYQFPAGIKTGDSFMQLKIAQKHSVLIIPDGLTWWRRRSGNATLNLFSNQRYNAEITSYRLRFLDANCPLNEEETEIARRDLYAIYLRLIFRLFIRGHFSDALYLKKSLKVPTKYYKAFFTARKSGYFAHITGDKPLHTPIESRE